MLPYSLIACMTILGAIASIFLKKAAEQFKGDTMVKAVFSLLKCPAIYIGGVLYCTAAVLNIIVLRYLDYSIVLPLTAFTYVWTLVLAKARLKENISVLKLVGVVLIILGAIMVSRPY